MSANPLDSKKNSAVSDWVWATFERVSGKVPLTLRWSIAGFLSVAYVVTGVCRLFERTIFGFDPRRPHAVVLLLGFFYFLAFGHGLLKDVARRDAERKRRDKEYDSSEANDTEGRAQLRRDIGMAPDESRARNGEL